MAGPVELENFVKKFVNLWQSGRNARLFVESQDGNAAVNLQQNLGEAQHRQGHVAGGQRAGGGPAQHRRRERRAAARQELDAAEEAAGAEKDKAAEEANVVEQTTEKRKETENAGNASEKEDTKAVKALAEEKGVTMSPIPQVDGACDVNSEVEYEIVIDAHETCTSEDIIEAIDTNFIGALDEIGNKENYHLRNIIIEKQNEPR